MREMLGEGSASDLQAAMNSCAALRFDLMETEMLEYGSTHS